jgi:macrolide-specific efflux system membrane fusion protein
MRQTIRVLVAAAMLISALAVSAQTLHGTIDWNRRVALGVGISGQILAVNVIPGDAVHTGQVLVELDPTSYEIALRKARNSEALYAAELQEQRADFEREQTMFDEGSLSTVRLKLEQLKLTRVESAHALTVLEREWAEYRLGLAGLRAPFDAWVVASGFAKGQFVNHTADHPVTIDLAERGIYAAHVLVDGDTAGGLSPDDEATVLVAGERFVGVNTTAGLEPVETVQESARYLVKVFFQSARLIRPGTPCTVEFP